MFKSILGSLIGAAAGLGVHYGIQQSTGDTYIWFPVVVGALTGIVARIFAGPASSEVSRYVSGFFAGVIALVAIFGFDIWMSMEPVVEHGPLKTSSSSADAGQDEDRGAEGESSDDSTDEDAGDEKSSEEGNGEESGDDAAANDDENTEESDDGDAESGDDGDADAGADGDGESGDGEEAGTDDADASDNQTGADSLGDRSQPPEGSVENQATKDRFAELIGKRDHETWYELYMPYVFSGIGVFLAYQIARGFGSAPSVKESSA